MHFDGPLRLNAEHFQMAEDFHKLPDKINSSHFPAKLWRMINNPANSAIYWDLSGEIIIIDQLPFEQLVLHPPPADKEGDGAAFKTSNFSSIVRQLNLYGFRKVQTNSCPDNELCAQTSVHLFHNPNFVRGKPSLLVNLKRLAVGRRARLVLGATLDGQPPNLQENHPQKRLMTGGSASPPKKRNDSPHPCRLPALTGSPIPPPPLGLVGHQWGCRPNPTAPRFGIPEQNKHFPPEFCRPAYSYYPPAFMSMPHQIQMPPFRPICPIPVPHPMMQYGRGTPGPHFQVQNEQRIYNSNINLNRIFQAADEMMPFCPRNSVKVVIPEEASTSEPDPGQESKELSKEDPKEELDRSQETG